MIMNNYVISVCRAEDRLCDDGVDCDRLPCVVGTGSMAVREKCQSVIGIPWLWSRSATGIRRRHLVSAGVFSQIKSLVGFFDEGTDGHLS